METSSWKTKTLLLGALIGAVTGLVGAFLLVQRAEQSKSLPKITAGEGVKVGLGVLGILRMLAEMVEKR